MPSEPVPYRWVEGTRVRERTSNAALVWTVVSQHGGLVTITRAGRTGSFTKLADWSELVQVRETEVEGPRG